MQLQKHANIRWCLLLVLTLIFAMAFAPVATLAEATPPPLDGPAYDPLRPEDLTEDQLYARSAILIDQDTGQVLFEKNADQKMAPASTTKIMTLMLGLEYGPVGEMITVPKSAAQIPGDSSVMRIKPGEEMAYNDLLYGLMISSGNDAANAIATLVSGSVAGFVDLMNQRAAELKLTGTHFSSAHGYDHSKHYTTAREMAVIAQAAMKDKRVYEYASATTHTLPEDNLRKKPLTLSSKTLFLTGMDSEFSYPYATGLKTGSTSKAGQCFVGTAEKDGVRLISVVFMSTIKYDQPRWMDTIKLMEYGFAQYRQYDFEELYLRSPLSITIAGSDPADPSRGKLTLDALIESGGEGFSYPGLEDEADQVADRFLDSLHVSYLNNLNAPVQKGDVLGYAQYTSADGSQMLRLRLVAGRDVAAPPVEEPLLKEPEKNSVPVAWYIFALIGAIISFVLITRAQRISEKRKKKHTRQTPTAS